LIPSESTLEAWKNAIKDGERYCYVFWERGTLSVPKTYKFLDGSTTILSFVKHVDRGDILIVVGSPYITPYGRRSIVVPVVLEKEPGRPALLSIADHRKPFEVLEHV
jgi:hypothetical protein